ncbi:response regulator [Pararhodospirillum photometricum]|nr:response regulator [Pararhodospirillum photometricum]
MTDRLRVMFVDDEPHILRGLQRSMARMEDRWDVVLCASGAEALAWMDENGSLDVVVSDMRMPEMDGADLLERVRARSPETLRVILSGYAESEAVLRTVGPAHLYLAKPCSPALLEQAIVRPVALRERMTDPSLRAVLAGLSHLPSLPQVFLEIDAELRSPQASARSVAAIIGRDMAMTAELLRLTNSAYFSLGAPAATPLQAIRALGLETVQTLVLNIGIFRQLNSGRQDIAPALEALTTYSLALAGAAERIALANGADGALSKVAHCAAMLSHIGTVVLLEAHADAYRTVTQSLRPGESLEAAERKVFHADHALIGAYLLGLWGFAPPVVEAVAYSGWPGEVGGDPGPLLVALHAARALGPVFPLVAPPVEARPPLDRESLARLGLDDKIPTWTTLVARSADEVV